MIRERDLFEELYGDKDESPRNGTTSADKIELDLVLHYDTGKALQVSETGEEASAVWLPKSQVEIKRSGKTTDATKKDGQRTTLPVISVSVPEWLAKDKGLI